MRQPFVALTSGLSGSPLPFTERADELAIRIFVEQGAEFDHVPVRVSEVKLMDKARAILGPFQPAIYPFQSGVPEGSDAIDLQASF
jgi:hypothetical protein